MSAVTEVQSDSRTFIEGPGSAFNVQIPSGFDTVLAVPTDEAGSYYVIGMCSNITMNSQRPITQLPELGSNFTFIIADAAQNTLSISRLMPLKNTEEGSLGNLCYEIYGNYHGTATRYEIPLMNVDLDYPVFDHPFRLNVILLNNDNGQRTIKSNILVENALFSQYNLGEIVAGRKNIPETAIITFGTQTEMKPENN